MPLFPNASTRHTVVSVRLDTDSLEAVEMLVESNLARSRSEAVAMLVLRGIHRSKDLLAHARHLADMAQRSRAAGRRGVDRKSQRDREWTDLHIAAMFFGPDRVTVLLDHGADLEARSRNDAKQTALHLAVSGRRYDLVRCLLEHGADPNAIDGNGRTALHYAAYSGDHYVAALMLRYKGDPSLTDRDGRTPRAIANARGHPSVADMLAQAVAEQANLPSPPEPTDE